MTSTPDAKAQPSRRNKEIVVNFDPARLAAPFFLRCGALLIDYIIVVIGPVTMLLLGRYFGNDGSRLVTGNLNDSGWLIATLIGVVNVVVLPIFNGQSIGKMLTGIQIVSRNGNPAPTAKIVLRQIVGYLLHFLTLGLGFALSAFNRTGRALDDLISGTVVIYADRRYK